jgi:hypothetical protein
VGFFVSTASANVTIDELGIIFTHPTVDYDLGAQFSGPEIAKADSLTTAIRNGSLIWRKLAGGTIQPATDYDSQYWQAEEENTGVGKQDDRVVTFKDLGIYPKAGSVLAASFSGNPKKAAVTFVTVQPDANYEIAISGTDARFYTWESKTVNGFTINTNANQALTATVNWTAVRDSNP